MTTPEIAVIIVTKNRAKAIERYALPSLAQLKFSDFICVVWDASDDDKTEKIVEGQTWHFPIYYFRAPRVGMTSQRNDAIAYVLTEHSSVSFILFIDDDCELSHDALTGVMQTFKETNAALVNIPLHPKPEERMNSFTSWLKRRLGMNRHGATEFLYNYGSCDEPNGICVDWVGGCGMAFRASIFRDEGYFFPEAFQRFGGYALGEDFAVSFFLHKKMQKCIFNSLEGYCIHHSASGGRLNISNMAAAKWYNFHLLFEAIYNEEHSARKFWLTLKFKVFMFVAAIKLLVRARSLDIPAVLRGIHEAQKALEEYHKDFDIRTLFKKQDITRN